MRLLVMWSVKVRAALVAGAIGLLILAFTRVPLMPVDTLPEFDRTTVEVQTEALGLSAEEIEQLVTVPLEQNLLNGVAFLEEIESASLPGLSSIVMTFEAGTDEFTARQVVTERLTQAAGMAGLVQVAKPPQMLQPRSSTSRVAMIRLSSAEQSLIELSVLSRWVIVPRLLGVEGVSNVAIWGFRDRQLQVTVDPETLRDQGVSLSQVVRTAGNALEVSPLSYLEASSPGTGGWIETVNQRLHIFHEQTINTPEELEQVPLQDPTGQTISVDGQVLTLGDVSEVVEDHQPLVGDAYCSPPDDGCLLLVVETFPDANTVAVAADLDATIETLRPGLGDIQIDTSIYQPAEFIKNSFSNLGRALAIGSALFLLVLLAFFRRWRPVVVAASAVLISLAVACLVLVTRGVTVNMMILAGLALGLVLIADDAIVGVERVVRRLRGPVSDVKTPAWRQVVEATLQTRSSLLYATLIGVAATVPLLFTTSLNGVFLSPIVASYVLAVAASMVVALTLTPALAVLLLAGGRPDPVAPPAVHAFERGYTRFTRTLARLPQAAWIVGGTLLGAGLVVLPFLQPSLRPTLREGDVLVHFDGAPGTSLQEMDAVMAAAVGDIAAISGVRNVGAHVGRAVASDQVVNVNSGEIWVNLDPTGDYAATLSAIESAVGSFPEVSSDVMTYSEERVSEVLQEPDPNQAVVRVYGESPDVLNATAAEVQASLSGIDGVTAASLIIPPEEPTIQVEVDLARAQLHGVSPGDVRRAAAILLSGLTVGNLFDEQKVFDVVVWGRPEIRQSESDVRELLIETPDGNVRLDEVADVRLASSPTVIRHHSVMTYRDIVVTVSEGDMGSVVGAVHAAIDQVDFPLEYHAEVLGVSAGQATSRTEATAVALAAAISIFLLFQAAFRSWRLATLAFLSLPAALAGGLVTILITGGRITIGSVAGLAGVVAIGARMMVLLIRDYQHQQLNNGEAFGPDLVAGVTRERVGPTLASAFAAAALLLPFVVTSDSVGFEILQPMTIVVLGGLITSTVISMAVIPALYLRFGNVRYPDLTAEELTAPLPASVEVSTEGAEI